MPDGLPDHEPARRLLHGAARSPLRGADVDAIAARGEVLAFRATGARAAAGVVAALAVVLPLTLGGAAVLSLDDPVTPAAPTTTSTPPPATTTTLPPAPSVPAPSVAPSGAPSDAPAAADLPAVAVPEATVGPTALPSDPAARPVGTSRPAPPVAVGPTGATVSSPRPTPAGSGSAAPSPEAPSSSGAVTGTQSHPLAAGCTVDNRGLLPGESRTCRFTARATGGYRVGGGGASAEYGDWEVRVRRGDALLVFGDGQDWTCATGVLRPGDRVDVVATASRSGVQLYEVRAGEDVRCG